MTLATAQSLAISALEAEFLGFLPKVYIEGYDGILSFREGKNRFRNTPVLLVSPIAADGRTVSLAVYALSSSSDRGMVQILDKATDALRKISGNGRPYLDVQARTLYDDAAWRLGLRLWALLAVWPHLADGAQAESADSPLATEKARIAALFPEGTAIALTTADAGNLVVDGVLPFVAILTSQGRFDDGDRRTVSGTWDGARYEQKAKGQAVWILRIKAYAASESEAEALLWPVLPLIPATSSDAHGWNTVTTVEAVDSGRLDMGAAVAEIIAELSVPALLSPVAKRVVIDSAVVPTSIGTA